MFEPSCVCVCPMQCEAAFLVGYFTLSRCTSRTSPSILSYCLYHDIQIYMLRSQLSQHFPSPVMTPTACVNKLRTCISMHTHRAIHDINTLSWYPVHGSCSIKMSLCYISRLNLFCVYTIRFLLTLLLLYLVNQSSFPAFQSLLDWFTQRAFQNVQKHYITNIYAWN